MQPFSAMPSEINWEIFSHLDAHSLARGCGVSRLWNSVLSHNVFWKHIVDQMQGREKIAQSHTISCKHFITSHALGSHANLGMALIKRLKLCMQDYLVNTTMTFDTHFLWDPNLFFKLRMRISDGWQTLAEPFQEQFCICMYKIDETLERISNCTSMNVSMDLSDRDVDTTFRWPFKMRSDKANIYCRLDYRLPIKVSNFLAKAIPALLQEHKADFEKQMVEAQNWRIQFCQKAMAILLIFLAAQLAIHTLVFTLDAAYEMD